MISKPHVMETIDEIRELGASLTTKTTTATRTVIINMRKWRIYLNRQKKSLLPLLRMVIS